MDVLARYIALFCWFVAEDRLSPFILGAWPSSAPSSYSEILRALSIRRSLFWEETWHIVLVEIRLRLPDGLLEPLRPHANGQDAVTTFPENSLHEFMRADKLLLRRTSFPCHHLSPIGSRKAHRTG